MKAPPFSSVSYTHCWVRAQWARGFGCPTAWGRAACGALHGISKAIYKFRGVGGFWQASSDARGAHPPDVWYPAREKVCRVTDENRGAVSLLVPLCFWSTTRKGLRRGLILQTVGCAWG